MKLPDIRRLWRKPEEQRTITGLPWDIGGPMVAKAPSIDQALSLVPVFGAVRLLASQISTLPLQTYRKVSDGRVKIPTGSLFSQPAAHGTSYAWLHRCVTSLALRGNAYGLITARDNMGYPTMIEWLHPDHVTVQDTALSGPGSYSQPIWYWYGRVLPAEDLVHIAWFTVPFKVKGLSPIEACAATISTGVSAQVYTADWFDSGAVPPGKFKNTQKTVSQVESDEIKARLNTAIKSRKPLVYGADWEYDPIAVGANEARFIETLQLNATQIASIYGIPPEMLGGQAGGALTYNTVEQNSINFVKFTLRPWLELLEETFSQLLPRPQYVKFNVDALLRGDLTTRVNAYKTLRDIGMNNIDELRNLEDWAPIPGGKGKEYDPLLVQIAASRGTDAAQIKANEQPTDVPPAELPPAQRSAEDDAGPKGSGSYGADGELDENVIALLLAFEEFDDWLTDGARSWDPAKHPRNPKGAPGGGKFRSLVDRLTDALKEHHKGGGKGDPFEGFSREQLRLTAKKRGIEIKRGEDRDSIAKKLLDHLDSGKPDVKPEKPKAASKAAALSGQKALDAAPIKLGKYDFDRGVEGDLAQELDAESLSMYRGEYYGFINDDLRDGIPAKDSEYGWTIQTMDAAMEHSKLTQDVVVHRGVKDMALFGNADTYGSLVGLEYVEDAYSSTTADRAVTEDFHRPGGAILNLRVPAGVGAIQLSDFGPPPPKGKERPVTNEAELLLQRGLRIRITGDRDVNGVRQLDAEVVPV